MGGGGGVEVFINQLAKYVPNILRGGGGGGVGGGGVHQQTAQRPGFAG